MCQPLWFLCLVWRVCSRQRLLSSLSFTGTLGLHCAVQFSKAGAWLLCFLKTSFSHLDSCMVSRYQGQGFMFLLQSRLGYGFDSQAKLLKEELEPWCNENLQGIPEGSSQGLEPKGQHFLPLINFNSFPVLFKVMRKKFLKIFELFYCKDLLQRTWELFYVVIISKLAIVCSFPPPWRLV